MIQPNHTKQGTFQTLVSNQRIYINDVGMRDGLQIEPIFVPTDEKVKMVNALSRTGLDKIEVTSFMSPKAIPALRDAEEVMHQIDRVAGVKYVTLVPNMRGAERAMACKADEMNLVMSASETHNLTNLRITRQQSRKALSEIIQEVKGNVAINISISASFGCPMEGDISPDTVFELGDWFIEQGANGITLCDTTGMANPVQVANLTQGLAERWKGNEITLHFHNTRGMGLANVIAGLATGIVHYDASLAGLGGCPYAPGATGNICTEDLVHMLQTMNLDTGIDLDKLLDCAKQMPIMVGHGVPGAILRGGPSNKIYPVPKDFEAIRTRALARDIA